MDPNCFTNQGPNPTITKKLIFKMSNQNHCCSEQHRPRQTAKKNPTNFIEKNIYTQSCPLRQKLPDKMSNQNHCCSEQHRQRQTVSQVSHVHADVALRRRHDAWSSYDDMCTVTPVTPTPSVSRPRRRRPPTSSRRVVLLRLHVHGRDVRSSYDSMCTVTPVTPTPSVPRPR